MDSGGGDTPTQGTDAKRETVLLPGLPPIRSAREDVEAADADPPPDWILDGLFEAGDKVLLIAPSKTGKTWAALALAEHLAAGRDFWGFQVARPLRVLYVNLEVTDRWMRRRLRGSLAVAGIGAEAVEGLRFMHARGKGELVRDAIERNPGAFAMFDLVILDPFYKLARAAEDENSARDIKGILDAIDKLAAAGPAVLTVKHDGKGDAGSKRKTDRGAGSYAAAADYDAALILTPHKDGKPRVVVSTVARNAAGRDDFVIRLEVTPRGCAFLLDEDAAPEVETDATRNAALRVGAGLPTRSNTWLSPEAYKTAAGSALAGHPEGLSTGALVAKIRDATGASERTIKNRLAEMCADGFLKTDKHGRETIHRLAKRNAEAEMRSELFGDGGRYVQK